MPKLVTHQELLARQMSALVQVLADAINEGQPDIPALQVEADLCRGLEIYFREKADLADTLVKATPCQN